MTLNLLLQRQIEQISTRAVMQKRADRIFLSEEVIPRNTELTPGKRQYTYPIINMQGQAAIIANQSFDVPGVDAFIDERTQKIELIYQPWTVPFVDEEEAAAGNVNIRGVQIEVATQSVYNAIDKLGYIGVPELNMFGIANQPNVLEYTLPADGAGSSTTWASKTAEQILRDAMAMCYYSSKVTSHAYNTTKLMLPPSAYEPFFQKVLSGSGVAESALTRFLVNQDYSKTGGIKNTDIIIAPGLETAGVGGTPIAIAYNPSPDNIEYLRTGLKQRPLHETVEGVKSALYCYAGATLVRQPLSVVHIEGI